MLAGGVEIGGRRAVSVTIFCRNGGAPANLLIQEGVESSNYSGSIEIKEPVIAIGEVTYHLNKSNVDFQGINNGIAMISLNLPMEMLLGSGCIDFRFAA